jgi:hypothetical protein
MQLKSLLPSIQEPATASSPGLDKTNLKSHNLYLKISFILYCTLCLFFFSRGLLPSNYFVRTTIFTPSFSHACRLYCSSLLLWLDHHFARTTSHQVRCHAYSLVSSCFTSRWSKYSTQQNVRRPLDLHYSANPLSKRVCFYKDSARTAQWTLST